MQIAVVLLLMVRSRAPASERALIHACTSHRYEIPTGREWKEIHSTPIFFIKNLWYNFHSFIGYSPNQLNRTTIRCALVTALPLTLVSSLNPKPLQLNSLFSSTQYTLSAGLLCFRSWGGMYVRSERRQCRLWPCLLRQRRVWMQAGQPKRNVRVMIMVVLTHYSTTTHPVHPSFSIFFCESSMLIKHVGVMCAWYLL